MLGELQEHLGPGEPVEPAPEGSSGWALWSFLAALTCALAGAAATEFGWEGSPPGFGRYGLSPTVWAALEGALVGLGSGLALAWWGHAGHREPAVAVVILLALVAGYVLVLSFLLEEVLRWEPLGVSQRVGAALQLSGVVGAALLGFVKARLIPLRPVLALAGGLFVSAAVAEVGAPALGALAPTAGLPYALALPIAWTIAEVLGGSRFETHTL